MNKSYVKWYFGSPKNLKQIEKKRLYINRYHGEISSIKSYGFVAFEPFRYSQSLMFGMESVGIDFESTDSVSEKGQHSVIHIGRKEGGNVGFLSLINLINTHKLQQYTLEWKEQCYKILNFKERCHNVLIKTNRPMTYEEILKVENNLQSRAIESMIKLLQEKSTFRKLKSISQTITEILKSNMNPKGLKKLLLIKNISKNKVVDSLQHHGFDQGVTLNKIQLSILEDGKHKIIQDNREVEVLKDMDNDESYHILLKEF